MVTARVILGVSFKQDVADMLYVYLQCIVNSELIDKYMTCCCAVL